MKKFLVSLFCAAALIFSCNAAQAAAGAVYKIDATEDFPAFSAKCTADMPGMKISFDAVLPAPVEDAELTYMTESLYAKSGGIKYKNFFVMWYLPKYKIGKGAWATSSYKAPGDLPDVQILKLQGE